MTHLNDIPVQFDQEPHKYYDKRTGEELQGITSTLIHRLFPDKYSGVPDDAMRKAQERGTVVHEDIELTETLGTEPSTQEGKNYLRLKADKGLNTLCSEYLVSDLKHYASSIDLVYDVEDGVVDLADIKTTSKLDRESVSWQLSIYAYMLELNNPEVKVRNLYGIWLRGDVCELIEVHRYSVTDVLSLIEADMQDKPFSYTPYYPPYIVDDEQRVYELSKKIRELTAELDEYKAKIIKEMSDHGDKSFDMGHMLITLVAPTEKKTFDTKKFQKDHADLYGQYVKTTNTKKTLKITLR